VVWVALVARRGWESAPFSMDPGALTGRIRESRVPMLPERAAAGTAQAVLRQEHGDVGRKVEVAVDVAVHPLSPRASGTSSRADGRDAVRRHLAARVKSTIGAVASANREPSHVPPAIIVTLLKLRYQIQKSPSEARPPVGSQMKRGPRARYIGNQRTIPAVPPSALAVPLSTFSQDLLRHRNQNVEYVAISMPTFCKMGTRIIDDRKCAMASTA
jgi:hypothetical protein